MSLNPVPEMLGHCPSIFQKIKRVKAARQDQTSRSYVRASFVQAKSRLTKGGLGSAGPSGLCRQTLYRLNQRGGLAILQKESNQY